MKTWKYGAGSLCRMDKHILKAVVQDDEHLHLIISACTTIVIGAMAYGFSFGIWRSTMQACYSAVKMPILLFTVTFVSSVINTMLAQVIGSGLSYRQVWVCILISLTVAAALLGSLSPVLLFLWTQLPPQDSPNSVVLYRVILLTNTALVGMAGMLGNIRLYRLLRGLNKSPAVAGRVLLSWILVTGFLGCEVSWFLSPFLNSEPASNAASVSFFNPDAFKDNFFEYVWKTASRPW